MAKYKKILVGVDGSDTSLHALKESFRLGTNWITVISVAPPYEGDLRLVGVKNAEALRREPCETAQAKAQELADAAGAFIKTVCVVGEPHEEIVDLAETGNCDLIVMGAKGHGLLERLLVGSVTRRVIGFSDQDVLVVPLAASIGWGRMLLATDGSPDSLRAAARALDLAKAYGGELKAVSVLDLPPQLYEGNVGLLTEVPQEPPGLPEVEAKAREMGVKIEILVRTGIPYEVITELAREEKMDLIIMGSHGRTGLKRLLMGSVTERVIGHAPCPVLVVKG